MTADDATSEDDDHCERVSLARAAFPVTRECTYLNTASMGPVSNVYADALAEHTSRDVVRGRAIGERYAAIEDAKASVRRELAALLECEPANVFLTQSTSSGLETVIDSFPFEHGDEVVSTNLEHRAAALPLRRRAHRRGLVLRIADVPDGDIDDLGWIEGLVTPRTRMIAVSAVAFETGARLPVEKITALARASKIATLLDAAQAAGASPLRLDALGVDYCALPLQKWLCGPEGLGALYARPESADVLTRPLGDGVVHGLGVLSATARHLEWMRTALGWQWVFERTADLAAHARDAVTASHAASLVTPPAHAGLTTVRLEGTDSEGAAAELARRGFVLRHLQTHGALRLATAFFNTKKEINSLLAAISQVRG